MGLPEVDMTSERTTVMRKEIDAHHTHWQDHQEVWYNTQVLYEGGASIKACADRFLRRRPKEDSTLYQHRLDGFDYENNVGTGLGWHEASMFEEEPAIGIRIKGQNGGNSTEAKLSVDQSQFYHERFLKNCDRKGTTFVDFFRTVFNQTLLYQHSYICVDMPDPDEVQVTTFQEQKEKKLLDPYLCAASPIDVINWENDDDGNLKWAVIYSKTEKQGFLSKPMLVERWYYYDRTMYRVYECLTDMSKDGLITGQTTATSSAVEAITIESDNNPVTLKAIGYHQLAKFNLVPIFKVSVQKGWWMANRVYLPAMEHVNLSNVLQWSLLMTGLAVPVICSDDDVSTITYSEMGFIKLQKGDTYSFAEPTGKVWQYLQERVNVLKEEIWRGMYLVTQARNTSATAAAQSGISKQQDMQPSHDVLNGLGQMVRAAMQSVLGLVAMARSTLPGGEGDAALLFDVRGYEFEDKLTIDDIVVIQDLLDMQVPSDLFDKELFILAVRAALKDVNPERLKEIIDQIVAAPNRQTIQLQMQQKQAEMQQANMRKQVTGLMKDDPEGG